MTEISYAMVLFLAQMAVGLSIYGGFLSQKVFSKGFFETLMILIAIQWTLVGIIVGFGKSYSLGFAIISMMGWLQFRKGGMLWGKMILSFVAGIGLVKGLVPMIRIPAGLSSSFQFSVFGVYFLGALLLAGAVLVFLLHRVCVGDVDGIDLARENALKMLLAMVAVEGIYVLSVFYTLFRSSFSQVFHFHQLTDSFLGFYGALIAIAVLYLTVFFLAWSSIQMNSKSRISSFNSLIAAGMAVFVELLSFWMFL
ncbi:MAG: hypothetical protein V4507_03600 [Verrucomicrobiota bacterium]